MPVERRAERLHRPLTPRDHRFLAALACAAAIAAGASAAVVARGGSALGGEGCVSVTVPSTMGGASFRLCGAGAAQFCREQAQRSGAVARSCRRASAGLARGQLPSAARELVLDRSRVEATGGEEDVAREP